MSEYFRKLPPLSTLVAFEAAYRHQNFSAAADEIARSQASVSRQIRQLEDSLGVRLFERQRHNVKPTAHGHAYASTVALILSELSAATQRLRSASGSNQSFIVFSDISIANVLVSPVLSEFQHLYPSLQLKILSSYEPIEHTSEAFDIGLQVGDRAVNRYHTEAIADDAVFPVCSPQFAQSLNENWALRDLASLPLLQLEDQGKGWPDWPEFFNHVGLDSKPLGPVFTSYDVCLEVAARGEGVALGWARSVQTRIDEGKLVRLSKQYMPLPDCIYVYLPRLKAVPAETQAFIALLKQRAKPLSL